MAPSGELELCELLIESVLEDLAVEKQSFGELDRICGQEAILATNTSTLPVVKLAMPVPRAGQVCGPHFFNPVPVTPMVEVVPVRTWSPCCGAWSPPASLLVRAATASTTAAGPAHTADPFVGYPAAHLSRQDFPMPELHLVTS
jgi:3-hydroxyacyl-CoA dehydrogenase, NAD binding domain